MRFGKRNHQAYIVSCNLEHKTRNCTNDNQLKHIEEMIHIASINALFWKEVKYNLHRFLAYGVANLLLLMLGSLLFFYVEHCLETKVPKTLNIGEQSFIEICNHHQKLLEKQQGNISSPLVNTTAALFANQIDLLCQHNKKIVLDERTCDLTVLEWYKWMEYTFSVAFTLGKLCVCLLIDRLV